MMKPKDILFIPLLLLLLVIAILLKIKTLLFSPKQFWAEMTSKKSDLQIEQKPFRSNSTKVIELPTADGTSRVDYGSNYSIKSKNQNYTIYFEFHGEPRAFADATYGVYCNDQATGISIWQGLIAYSSDERFIAASGYPSRETIIIDTKSKTYTQTKDIQVVEISKLTEPEISNGFPVVCWKYWADQMLPHAQT
jgi:hypothetical protein